MPRVDPQIQETVDFYETAPDSLLDEYEAALDDDDVDKATTLRRRFLSAAHSPPQFPPPQAPPLTRRAARPLSYTEYPPVPGDMVYTSVNGHYARLLSVSSDKELAVVKEWTGAYVVPYTSCKRTR